MVVSDDKQMTEVSAGFGSPQVGPLLVVEETGNSAVDVCFRRFLTVYVKMIDIDSVRTLLL